MGTMSYIHYLCEKGDMKALKEEVGELAEGFMEAHNTMRDNRDNPAFKVLNEIVDESLKTDLETAKEEGKNFKGEVNNLFKDIKRAN